jgi:putative pyruvate formate lyase activating enzyme
LEYAISKGFNLPIIYNTNAYDSLNVLKLLDGIFDIYLPDIKYSNDDNALRYSKIRNYVYHSRKAIAEMYRQVGSKLKMENGVLKRGMIIRHLILPDDLSGSYNSLRYISELDKNISISLMAQYYPSHIANNYGQLSRTVNKIEYERVMDWMDKLELENGFIQELESSSTYQPDFTDKENPFKF